MRRLSTKLALALALLAADPAIAGPPDIHWPSLIPSLTPVPIGAALAPECAPGHSANLEFPGNTGN